MSNRDALFVSYHYTMKHGDSFYTGFSNCILNIPKPYPDEVEYPEEFLENITESCDEHCRKTYGANSTTTVLYFKWFFQ